jgi:hypothetical protein
MSAHFFDADSSRRVARMVQAVERDRGDASGNMRRRVGLPQVLPMVCMSQPNIEAIDAGGVWPTTILATPLSERYGYKLGDVSGACLPPENGEGGGNNCLFPCWNQTITITAESDGPAWRVGDVLHFTYAWGDYVPGAAWTIGYSGTDEQSSLFTLTAYGLRDLGGCEIRLSYKPTSGTTDDPYLYVGPLSCSTFGLQDQILFIRRWSGVVGIPITTEEPTAEDEPETPVDADQTEAEKQQRLYRVKVGIFGQGVPLRGQVFCAYYYGGTLYHVGFRNACLVGPGTGDTTPYTIATENCGNRVPWSWPHVDYGDKEGARLVIGWNHGSKRYEPIGVTC